MKKLSEFSYLKIFIFGGKIFSIFEKACFRNDNIRVGAIYNRIVATNQHTIWIMEDS